MLPSVEDWAYQDLILQGVSRTFALTIPELPDPLRRVVGNAYLLCRIADTIEDDAELDPEAKRRHALAFSAAVGGDGSAVEFARTLAPALSPGTPLPEQDLVANSERVLRITQSFNVAQRRALARCVRIMSSGMADYQDTGSLAGLADLSAMSDYCYYVAGVVGEMLTELFCDHSPRIAARRDTLMPLAVSFGQGLQMTNILKDIWEDRQRGACWLPRDVFAEAGIELGTMTPGTAGPGFAQAMDRLVGVARRHLENALRYTLCIPSDETGIRRFCLWALGMAVLTLRRIHEQPGFTSGQQVKISRRSVRATVLLTSVFARSDTALRALFALAARRLPSAAAADATLPLRCTSEAHG